MRSLALALGMLFWFAAAILQGRGPEGQMAVIISQVFLVGLILARGTE
jgi:hypothetical protein